MWQGARHLLARLQATAAAAAAAGEQQQPAVGGVLYACELAGLQDLLLALQQWLDEANQQQQQQQQEGYAKRRTRGVEAVAAVAAAAAAAAGVPAGLDNPAGEFVNGFILLVSYNSFSRSLVKTACSTIEERRRGVARCVQAATPQRTLIMFNDWRCEVCQLSRASRHCWKHDAALQHPAKPLRQTCCCRVASVHCRMVRCWAAVSCVRPLPHDVLICWAADV
jgi:hypothetical protein